MRHAFGMRWRASVVALALLAGGVVAAATPGPAAAEPAPGASFSDVPVDHPFRTEIGWLADVGVTTGYADGTFHPVEAVSRQAMAAFLYRYAGRQEYAQPDEPRFSDVPIDHPFYTEISWLAAQGITTGYADGTFHPTEVVSRQAMAAFLYRFANRPPTAPGEVPRFSDVPTSSGFFSEIEWLAGSAVTTGYADGTFHPLEDVSRQAMAAFLYRVDTRPQIMAARVDPGPVTDATAISTDTHAAELAWASPAGDGFVGVTIRRAVGPTPPDATSGEVVGQSDGQLNRWTDTTVAPGTTYSYALVARYADGSVVDAATASVAIPATESITGAVTAPGGAAVPGVAVQVVNADGLLAATTTTAADGTYAVAGLTGGSYTVCFVPGGVTGSGSTGYRGQCYQGVAPDGTPTPVTVGEATTTGVDAVLAVAGSVSGTVVGPDGEPLAGVVVDVELPGGQPIAFVSTDADGRWRVAGLEPGTYGVCFDPTGVAGSTTYAVQCWDSVDPTQAPTPVTVSAGVAVAGLDATLATASAARAVVPGEAATRIPASGITADARPEALTQPASGAVQRPVVSSAALGGTACADVLFLGARGSGEPGPGGAKQNPGDPTGGLGSRVMNAYRAFADALPAGRVVQPATVFYAADAVEPFLLVSGIYVAHLWEGVVEARRALTARANQCENERVVLAGYSQGAMLIHRVLRNDTTGAVASMSYRILARVDATVLLADGDRMLGEPLRSSGSAPTNAVGVGTLFDETMHWMPVDSETGVRTWSVCDVFDAVCDTARVLALLGPGGIALGTYAYAVHTEHYLNEGAAREAGRSAAGALRVAPPRLAFTTPTRLPTAVVGQPYHVQFGATGGTGPYTYAFASRAPDIGLRSWSGGRWFGTPTRAGVFSVGVRVTDAAGRQATQDFQIEVLGPDAAWRLRRVTEGWDGTAADQWSEAPSTSADGKWVVYASRATNLVPGDTNGKEDVFLTDQTTGRTRVVSKATDWTPGNGDSSGPGISADGRWIAYTSSASNLVPGDTNGMPDLFVTDALSGTTVRASRSSGGVQADGASWGVSLSADGRWLVFRSEASNLVPGDTNGALDLFRWDRTTGAVDRVSVDGQGEQLADDSGEGSLSGDGRWLSFTQWRFGPWPGAPGSGSDVYVKDLLTGALTRISPTSAGTDGILASGCSIVSGDGNVVAFGSQAPDVVPGDTNGHGDVFAWDRRTGQVTLVSRATDGTQGDGESGCPGGVSADGRWVTYLTMSNNLVAASGTMGSVVVTDRGTGQTSLVSRSHNGAPTVNTHASPEISADGQWVVFASSDLDLVPGGLMNVDGIFIARNPLRP